jgi:hypothetical protein
MGKHSWALNYSCQIVIKSLCLKTSIEKNRWLKPLCDKQSLEYLYETEVNLPFMLKQCKP